MKFYTFPFLFFLLVFGVNVSSTNAQGKLFLSKGRAGDVINASGVSEAGGDIASSVETSASYIVLSLNTNNRYQILVRRQDVNWNGNLNFYVRRTGNGTGQGQISAGTNYIQLSTLNQTFFTGRRARSNIPIQYMIDGISLTIPAGNHETNVVYTITDF